MWTAESLAEEWCSEPQKWVRGPWEACGGRENPRREANPQLMSTSHNEFLGITKRI